MELVGRAFIYKIRWRSTGRSISLYAKVLKDVIEEKFPANCFFYSQKIRTFAPAKQKEKLTGALVQ